MRRRPLWTDDVEADVRDAEDHDDRDDDEHEDDEERDDAEATNDEVERLVTRVETVVAAAAHR